MKKILIIILLVVLSAFIVLSVVVNVQKHNRLKAASAAVEKASKATEAAHQAYLDGEKQRDAGRKKMERLKELAKLPRMNTNETREARKLIKELEERYGDLRISIEESLTSPETAL